MLTAIEIKNRILYDNDELNRLDILFDHALYLTFRSREKELQKYDLSPEQVQVLSVVQDSDQNITPIEISRILLRQPHAISSILDRMVKKGLIKKKPGLGKKE